MKSKITTFLLLCSILSIQTQNLQVFDSFTEFQNALTKNCSNTNLTFENFDGILQRSCGSTTLPSSIQLCFAPNELEDGYIIRGSSGAPIFASAVGEFGGTPINLVGPNDITTSTFLDFFPNVYAVSFSTWQNFDNPGSFDVKLIGGNFSELGSFNIDSPLKGVYSFHVISDVPIARIETNGNFSQAGNTAGILVGDLYFGAMNCNITLSADSFNDISNSISIFPNPIIDVVNINFDGIIKRIEIFNILGERILIDKLPNDFLNINELESGVYFMKLETDLGQAVKKLIKK